MTQKTGWISTGFSLIHFLTSFVLLSEPNTSRPFPYWSVLLFLIIPFSAPSGVNFRSSCRIATAEAIALGVDPRLVLSGQLLYNPAYRRHSEKLSDLEKRARLLSAEYREIQRARPIDVVPVSGG